MKLIYEWFDTFKTGLSPHYFTIYSIVRGLETKSAFEFGTGGSTKTILEALSHTHGNLYSISTESRKNIESKYNIEENLNNWFHITSRTDEMLENFIKDKTFDFVLHDSSHTEEIVFYDLNLIIPRIKFNGILCVHDTLHQVYGNSVYMGIKRALESIEHEIITIPFSYGLTMVRIMQDQKCGSIEITRKKSTSSYYTKI